MKSSFENLKLKDISKIYSGNSINEKIKEQKYTGLENGVEYISTKDISFNSQISYDNGVKIPFNELDNFKTAPKNTIFICAEGGSAGRKLAISDRELCFVNKLFAVVASKFVLPKYLFYSLKTEDFIEQFNGSMTGIIGGVSLNKFRELEIKVPSRSIQQKIVAKLDAIFAEIDTATAAAKANAKNAEALFQSYLNEVFSSNENLTKLKDCTQIKPPKSEIKNLKGNTSVSFMPMESLGINDKFTISKQSKDLESVSGSYTYFTEGDVLLAKITPWFENGKLGIASNLVNGIGFGSSEYIVFRPNKIIDKEWLYYFLNRESFRVLGSQHMSGSVGHKRVTKEFIEETLIPLIPIAKQKEFVGKIDNVFLQSQILKSASKSKIRELTLLKQSILQRAFSGELVKD